MNQDRSYWKSWLGLNSSTVALLATILLVTAATELWSPLVPQYLNALRTRALAGDVQILLIIGAYGFYCDFLEAVNYYVGGAISGHFNTRRSLMLFNLLPLVGLVVLAFWDSVAAVFIAIPFIFIWNSIAGPATITVVGDSLPADRRTMAFSMQSIVKRISRILAYVVSAPLVWALGRIQGVRTAAVLALIMVLGAAVIQFHFMRTASKDDVPVMHRPRSLFRQFDPNLKRLLAADILARWAESLAGPFVILYCVPILSGDHAMGTALYASVLLTIQAVTSLILYLVIGPLASREGFAKKPYIGLTFVFFALFPIALAVLGTSLGAIGLAIAFIIGGMREIGEPARKAMIADLVPREVRTQAVGLYWSIRSVVVMWAAPVGALLWILGNRWSPGRGPLVLLASSGLIGIVGAAMFYARFARGAAKPTSG